jgi:hypothetical protein
VVFVCQSPPATDGDQPRITLLREDRHTPIPTIHEAITSRTHCSRSVPPAIGGLIGWRTSRPVRFG